MTLQENRADQGGASRASPAIAIRLRELEALGQRIFDAVIRGKALDDRDPLEIPDFLRRY